MRWVIGLSVLYIGGILAFRGGDAWELLRAGNLNELGDFLAGLFTPLAFGWLVYGYLLQSSELRLQREELTLTREQLGKQTRQLDQQTGQLRRQTERLENIDRKTKGTEGFGNQFGKQK